MNLCFVRSSCWPVTCGCSITARIERETSQMWSTKNRSDAYPEYRRCRVGRENRCLVWHNSVWVRLFLFCKQDVRCRYSIASVQWSTPHWMDLWKRGRYSEWVRVSSLNSRDNAQVRRRKKCSVLVMNKWLNATSSKTKRERKSMRKWICFCCSSLNLKARQWMSTGFPNFEQIIQVSQRNKRKQSDINNK